MNLIVRKTGTIFDFCESSDGIEYDGIIYGGNSVKLSYLNNTLNVQTETENNSYDVTVLNYDDGVEIIGFASMLEFIETLKTAGFTGNFNSGGATPQVNDKENIVSGIVASGTNTYTATYSPTITAYTDGLKVIVRFTNANTSTATLNLNGLGAKAIVKGASSALVSGDIPTGTTLLLAYDGTNFVIVGSQLVNQFFDWSPTYGGFSTPPSGGVNRYSLQDKLCNFMIQPTINGTSNATTFTVTLPFNAKNLQVIPVSISTDNGVSTSGGYAFTTAGSNVLTFVRPSGTWTASGGKRVSITGWYEIQ